MNPSILLVEDEQNIADLLRLHLGELGYAFEHAADGELGLQRALAQEYSLVILDINLPKMNGLDVCKALRKKKERLPIIMLTSKDSDLDKVLGLELGADDYVTKPFSIHELVARIRARLRLQDTAPAAFENPGSDAEILVYRDLEIDLVKRGVRVRNESVTLTAKEFDVLAFLASHPGRPFSRDQLLETIWGVSSPGYEDNVNSLMVRLRKKIEIDPANPTLLLTVWGIGYKFVDPDADESSAANSNS